jgi:hypothetical protein
MSWYELRYGGVAGCGLKRVVHLSMMYHTVAMRGLNVEFWFDEGVSTVNVPAVMPSRYIAK